MKILFTLLIILISFSFSQEPINYETTLIERDGLFYTKDTNKPYSGPVFTLYEDGQKKEEGSLKDGKMISQTKWKWYENGQKNSEGTFKDGVPDELEMYWYENGQKYREITYQDGELINEIYWTEDGLDYGELIFYFKNGDIWKKGYLKDGKRDGEFIEYGLFGSRDIYHKRIVQNYKDGKLDGEYIHYFDTGDVNVVGNYKDGKLEGENTYYDKNGKIYWKGIYKDDVLVNETSFIGSKGPFRLN